MNKLSTYNVFVLLICLLFLVPCGIFAGGVHEEVDSGVTSYSDEQYEEALTYFETAQGILKESPEILFNKALTLNKLGRFDEAESSLKEAESYSQDDRFSSIIYNTLGNTALQKAQSALEDQSQTQDFNPLDVLKEAVNHYSRSLELDRSNEDAAWNLELARHHMKQVEEQQKQMQHQQQQMQDQMEQLIEDQKEAKNESVQENQQQAQEKQEQVSKDTQEMMDQLEEMKNQTSNPEQKEQLEEALENMRQAKDSQEKAEEELEEEEFQKASENQDDAVENLEKAMASLSENQEDQQQDGEEQDAQEEQEGQESEDQAQQDEASEILDEEQEKREAREAAIRQTGNIMEVERDW